MNTTRGLGYKSSEADKLVLMLPGKPTTRKESTLSDPQKLVAEDVPVAPIFNDISLYAVRKEVKGLQLIHFSNPLWKRFGLMSDSTFLYRMSFINV